MEIRTGHAAVSAASERLDHPGMQARLQIACKDQLWAALKKEVALGLSGRELSLGLAGFIATIITTMVMAFFDEEGRKNLALTIARTVTTMMEETDWTDAAWNKQKDQDK